MLAQLNTEAIEMIMQPFHHLDHFIVLQHGYSDRAPSSWKMTLPDGYFLSFLFILMIIYCIIFSVMWEDL